MDEDIRVELEILFYYESENNTDCFSEVEVLVRQYREDIGRDEWIENYVNDYLIARHYRENRN